MGNKHWIQARKIVKNGAAAGGLVAGIASAPTPRPLDQQNVDYYKTTRSNQQARRSRELNQATRRKNQPTFSETLWGVNPPRERRCRCGPNATGRVPPASTETGQRAFALPAGGSAAGPATHEGCVGA